MDSYDRFGSINGSRATLIFCLRERRRELVLSDPLGPDSKVEPKILGHGAPVSVARSRDAANNASQPGRSAIAPNLHS